MGNRYASWSAAAVLAGAALVGCGAEGMTDDPVTGAGGMGGAAGTVLPGAGSGGTTTTAGQGAAGAAGVGTPPAGGSGASGGGGSAGQTPPAAGGSGGDGGMGGMSGDGGVSGGGGAMSATGSCGPETNISAADLGDPMMHGPWTPTHEEGTGPNGSSWIYHPEELGMGGMKHPVFQWGPGAFTGPAEYLEHLNLLASHGFVIISQPSTQSGREALDWILEQNETQGSTWFEKLDPDRVGRGGHSMGALQSFSEADDPRLKLAVLVCGGASGGSGAADMSYPTIFLGGQGEGGTVNFAGDYAEVTGLSVFVTKTDTAHVPCARNNLGPWVAFMRWQFCGEEKWKAEFMPDGTYCKAPWLACMTKNL